MKPQAKIRMYEFENVLIVTEDECVKFWDLHDDKFSVEPRLIYKTDELEVFNNKFKEGTKVSMINDVAVA